MTDSTSLITFPCDFCIKVIGNNVAELEHDLIKLTQQHYPEFYHLIAIRNILYCHVQLQTLLKLICHYKPNRLLFPLLVLD